MNIHGFFLNKIGFVCKAVDLSIKLTQNENCLFMIPKDKFIFRSLSLNVINFLFY